MQTQFRASNPPIVTQPSSQPQQQMVQLPSQPQFMIVQQQAPQPQQQQQFTSNEQYAVVPPQYLVINE